MSPHERAISVHDRAFFMSAAGFPLRQLPGGAWRVDLHTVPLLASLLIALMIAAPTILIALPLLGNPSEHAKALFLSLLALVIPVFNLKYILDVLQSRFTVEIDLARKTIRVPLLPHPRHPLLPIWTTLQLNECAGMTLIPWKPGGDQPWAKL